jgi:hypothetical protein
MLDIFPSVQFRDVERWEWNKLVFVKFSEGPVEFRKVIMEPCNIWDSHRGGYEEFCLVVCNAV